MIFEKVFGDARVRGEYEKISVTEKAVAAGIFAFHDWAHVCRVLGFCEKIAAVCGCDAGQIDEVKTAAILHDIGCATGGKSGHSERSFLWARDYLAGFDMDAGARGRILGAIRGHSGLGLELIGKILAVADKIEICKARVSPAGEFEEHNIWGYGHISGAEIGVSGGDFCVDFKSDGGIGERGFQAMDEYYFTKKIFEAVGDLAKFLGRGARISVDGKVWKLK
jgi:hypothetical protein